jgi:hypothetical protein
MSQKAQKAQKAAYGVHRASIWVYIRIDLAEDPTLSARFLSRLRRPSSKSCGPILLASGDETGRTHHLPTKSLIVRAKAHDLSDLQIISALPPISASKGQMQAVSAKSGAVQPYEIDRTNMGLPSRSACVRGCCFPACSAERSFPTSLSQIPSRKPGIEPLEGNSRDKGTFCRKTPRVCRYSR